MRQANFSNNIRGIFKLLCFIIVFAFQACTSQRLPSSIKKLEGRIQIHQIQLNEKEELILAGLKATNSKINQDRYLSLKHYGWAERSNSKIDPKFIFRINEGIVTHIYSLDLGNWNNKRAFGGAPHSRRNHRNRFRPQDPSKYSALPPLLLDIDKPRKTLVKRLIGDIVIEGLSYAPLGSIAYMVKHLANHTEDLRKRNAAYLEALLVNIQSTPQLSPELSEALSEKEIQGIISSLRIRYSPHSKYGGLFVAQAMREDYSNRIQAMKNDNTSEHLARLTRIANENSLWLYPLSPNHSLIAYNPEQSEALEHFEDFELGLRSPKNLPRDLQNLSKQKSKLIPLGIISNNQTVSSTSLVDFQKALNPAVRSRLQRVVDATTDIGFNFIPMPLLAISMRIAGAGVSFVMKKNGSTFFESKIRSYGELQALLELGLAYIPLEELLTEGIRANLNSWGFSKEEIKYIDTQLATNDPKIAKATIEDIFGSIVKKESDDSFLINTQSPKEQRHTKEVHLQRLENWLGSKESKRTPSGKSTRRAGNGKPSIARAIARPATIFFLVDGLRPDRLIDEAMAGRIPTIKKYFVDRGVKLNSVTNRSLTLPSWATILSGREVDEHGLKSNNPVSRNRATIDNNFLDARHDLLIPKYINEGRSFRHLKASQSSWIPGHFSPNETLLSFMPINNGAYPPVSDILGLLGRKIKSVGAEVFAGVEFLDEASANVIAKNIINKPGQHKFVSIWLASIDEHSHYSNHQLDWGYKAVDSSIAKIIQAAKSDPVLKNAQLYLISDHGHLGGIEKEINESCPAPLPNKKRMLDNTGFNLTKFFAGDFFSSRDLDFVVGSSESPEPDHDISYLKEFLIHPQQYLYRGKRKNQGPRSIMVDYSGDNMAQIYLLKNKGTKSSEPLIYSEIKSYRKEASGPTIDLASRLLKTRVNNLEGSDIYVMQCISKATRNRPVGLFAARLGRNAIPGIKKNIPSSSHRPWSRDPLIVQSHQDKTGIILSSRNQYGVDIFQYFIVKNFTQSTNGTVSFDLENNYSHDPLGIMRGSLSNSLGLQGLDERAWFKINQKHKVSNLAAPMGIVRALTLSETISSHPDRKAEIPDFVLYSNTGFAFHSSAAHQSDHGGLSARESETTLRISGLGTEEWNSFHSSDEVVLTKDIAATVYSHHNIRPKNSLPSSISFTKILQNLRIIDTKL